MSKSGLKCRELAEELMRTPENEVWCGAWNGYTNTYAVVDHVLRFRYDQVSNDFFGTPGRMDKRLFENKTEEITYVSTLFGSCPNPDVDFGDDNIDYQIKTLNGEDGDPDLLWKLNGFQEKEKDVWSKEDPTEGWSLKYNTETEILELDNYRNEIKFTGKVVGIESLREIVKACKVNVILAM